ncbi:MAG TPA: hypothetical protein VFY93_03205, partial [Planctomycetota bacterium]|nr:hypothetical protein [Planctomycetota bacterium]
MRRAGVLGAILGAVLVGCGGGGGPAPALFLACNSVVAEGATVRLTFEGNGFVDGLVTVTPGEGAVSHVTVDGPELISFDFTAPTFPSGTLGPREILFSVVPRPGYEASTCSVTVHLRPFVTACVTSYLPDASAAPTTGVDAGALVVAT